MVVIYNYCEIFETSFCEFYKKKPYVEMTVIVLP